MRVGKRLEKILEFLDENEQTVADIGTDHGFLALRAIEKKGVSLVYATDISKESLKKAEDLAINCKLQDKIICIVSDGFNNIKEKVDTAVIAGIGGNEIIKILTSVEDKTQASKFILQPMQDVEQLREYLFKSGYAIIKDETIEDKSKYYSVIKCRYSGDVKRFDLADIYVGKTDKTNKGKDFIKFLEYSINKLKSREKFLSESEQYKLNLYTALLEGK